MKYLIELSHQYKEGDLVKRIEDGLSFVIIEVDEYFSSARTGSLKSIEEYKELLEDILRGRCSFLWRALFKVWPLL